MKNVINYYYNIVINEYKKRENSFLFCIDKNNFEFTQYYGDINKLINLYSILRSYRKEVDEIIINRDNQFITYYEKIPYVLLKKTTNKRKNINLYEINNYDSNVYINEEINWKTLWKAKLDYCVIQLNETKINNNLLKESFHYYSALSEISISLLNYVNYKNINFSIAHRRLEKDEDLFNPLNIIIDNKVRDIAEYIKINFFTDKFDLDEFINYIKTSTFSSDEIILFLARLMYPSYYFDIYERVYMGKESQKDLIRIIKKNAEYEAFLKKTYNFFKQLYNIPQIEFLEY